MTKKISETKPIVEFRDIASKFCLLIENRDAKKPIQLLQEAFIILPQLCLCGMRLPDIKKLSDYEVPDVPNEQWYELFESLQYRLKDYDVYTEVFDPYDEEDQNPIHGTLSDDLSDIYRDIKNGLQEWENVTTTERLDIIWHWKFLFEHHWGHHATGVFRALYSLLYQHIEGEYELYIGIREEG